MLLWHGQEKYLPDIHRGYASFPFTEPGMSSKHPPLTYREVIRGLKNLGFAPRKKTGASHEQWVKIVAGRIYKVIPNKEYPRKTWLDVFSSPINR